VDCLQLVDHRCRLAENGWRIGIVEDRVAPRLAQQIQEHLRFHSGLPKTKVLLKKRIFILHHVT